MRSKKALAGKGHALLFFFFAFLLVKIRRLLLRSLAVQARLKPSSGDNTAAPSSGDNSNFLSSAEGA